MHQYIFVRSFINEKPGGLLMDTDLKLTGTTRTTELTGTTRTTELTSTTKLTGTTWTTELTGTTRPTEVCRNIQTHISQHFTCIHSSLDHVQQKYTLNLQLPQCVLHRVSKITSLETLELSECASHTVSGISSLEIHSVCLSNEINYVFNIHRIPLFYHAYILHCCYSRYTGILVFVILFVWIYYLFTSLIEVIFVHILP